MKFGAQIFSEPSEECIFFLETASCHFFNVIFNGIDRRQDEELDELSLSVQRIGGVGLTIHEELLGQVE